MLKKIKNDIKELDGIEIFIGYKCNLKCNFCHQKDLRIKYKTNLLRENVIILLEEGYRNGKRFVIFSGGEPTLDDNLYEYIGYARDIGFQHIRVHTNGFGFRDYKYLEKLYNKGMTGITISIHGYKEIHDNITGIKGSFYNIIKALVNFEKLKKIDKEFVFDINLVISKDNYRSLLKIISFLSRFNFTRLQMVLAYSLKLFNLQEKKQIIPNYSDIIPFIIKSIVYGEYYNKLIVIENIPFCLIDKKYWKNILGRIFLHRDSITVDEKYDEKLDDIGKTKLTRCSNCKLNKVCKGIPEDYLEVYKDFVINPIYD